MKAIQYFSFLFLISLSSISLSFAAEEQDVKPQVEKMLSEIKQAGSYKPLLGHVDWNVAYSGLSDDGRKELHVENASELEAEMKAQFENPAIVQQRLWREKERSMTPQEREVMQPHFDAQLVRVRNEWAEMNKKLKDSDYKIVTQQIEKKAGRKMARVTLKDPSSQEIPAWNLNLVAVGKQWLLADISLGGLGIK